MKKLDIVCNFNAIQRFKNSLKIFRRLWKLKIKSKSEFFFTSSIAMAEIRTGNLCNGKLNSFPIAPTVVAGRNSMFSVLEKTVSELLNHWFIELFYKKNFMVLKFCMGARDLTADGKLIK